MAFDPSISPLLTPLNISDTPSYGLPFSSNVVGNSTYNTDVQWGGPGGTFTIVTTGNLAQIAQISSSGFLAIKGSEVVSAILQAGTGIGVTPSGNDYVVSVQPSSTVQWVNAKANSISIGSPRNTINLIGGSNVGVTLVDSGTSFDYTISAGGGAAQSAPFVITQADSLLTGATNLGALTSGYVVSTVTSGVSTLSTVSPSTFATLAGTQTFTGVNTFSQPPVMSGASILPGTIAISAINGSVMTLNTVQTVAAAKTFGANVILSSGLQITTGAAANAVLTSDASGNATWQTSVVGDATLAGTQTFTGVNTFSQQAVFTNSIKVPLGAGVGLVLTSDASGNGTWHSAGAGDVLLAGANVFTGTNTFNSNIPTTTLTPTLPTQFISKAYADATYATIAGEVTLGGANAWTGTNSYNVSLPTSTVVPANPADLLNKAYGDANYVNVSGAVRAAGNNTFTGTNIFNTNAVTFGVAPVMSGASITSATIPAASVVGTAATLAATQTLAGVNTFSQTVHAPSVTISDANSNVFIGKTLNASTGSVTFNTSYGVSALGSLTSGVGNVAEGHFALTGLVTGSNNTAIGTQSGANAGAGDTCTFVGYNSGLAAFAGPFSNSTALGANATISASNQIVIGTTSEAVVIPSGTPTATYVWTCQDTLGTGAWQAGGGGGGGTTVTVSTTDATPTALATVAIPSNQALTINGYVAARNSSGTINNTTGGRFTCTAINTAGVVTLAATPDVTVQSTSTGTFNVVVSGTNLIVQVTGIAATAYNWKSTYTTVSL